MENVIHQTTAQDIFKVLYWIIGAGATFTVAAAGFVWKASRKMANIDAEFKAHAAAAEFHAKDDTREFGLISRAIEEQKGEWQAILAKFHDTHNSMQKIATAVEVMQVRFESVADDIKEMRGQNEDCKQ